MAFPLEKSEWETSKNRKKSLVITIVSLMVITGGVLVYFRFKGTSSNESSNSTHENNAENLENVVKPLLVFTQSYVEGFKTRLSQDESVLRRKYIDIDGNLVRKYATQFVDNFDGWKALYNWVLANYSYLNYIADIGTENMILRFEATHAFSCDSRDIANILASLYLAAGRNENEVRVIRGFFEGRYRYWTELKIENHWLPLEFTLENCYFEKYATIPHVPNGRLNAYNHIMYWNFVHE